jgi:hypothetical protein
MAAATTPLARLGVPSSSFIAGALKRAAEMREDRDGVLMGGREEVTGVEQRCHRGHHRSWETAASAPSPAPPPARRHESAVSWASVPEVDDRSEMV